MPDKLKEPKEPKEPKESKSYLIARGMAQALQVVEKYTPIILRSVERNYPAWSDNRSLSGSDLQSVLRAVNRGITQAVYSNEADISNKLLANLKKNSSKEAIDYTLSNPDRFNMVFGDRRRRAAVKLYEQIRDGALKQQLQSYGRLQDFIREKIIAHYPLRTWSSYEGARIRNVQIIIEAKAEGVTRYKWKLSPGHRVRDICNEFVGEYPITSNILPPAHPWCSCLAIPILSSRRRP